LITEETAPAILDKSRLHRLPLLWTLPVKLKKLDALSRVFLYAWNHIFALPGVFGHATSLPPVHQKTCVSRWHDYTIAGHEKTLQFNIGHEHRQTVLGDIKKRKCVV